MKSSVFELGKLLGYQSMEGPVPSLSHAGPFSLFHRLSVLANQTQTSVLAPKARAFCKSSSSVMGLGNSSLCHRANLSLSWAQPKALEAMAAA